MRTTYLALLSTALCGWLLAAAPLGCDDDSSTDTVPPTGGSGGTTSTGGNFGGFGNTGGSGGYCANGCSNDLKKVVSCTGEVLEICPGDQACLNAACTDDPCGAAEAAKSSYGCDYWAVKPDIIPDARGACFAVFIANTWSEPVQIEVSRNGQSLTSTSTDFIRIPEGQGQSLTFGPYDATGGLPVGEVAVVFLSHESPQPPPPSIPGCPVAAAVNAEAGLRGTGRGTAFNLVTSRPVVAYSILPYGGGQSAATSASLLLPTSAWDTNYVAVNAYEKSLLMAEAQPSLNLLAFQDDTEVTILPNVAIEGSADVAGSPAGTAVTYTLNAGEHVQISQDAELTGSPIQATKPIGVWGGASCMHVPAGATACDSAHQQIPPVRALGSEYVGVRYRNRATASGPETPPWRLVGAVDGTELTWSPSVPPGAPTSLDFGDVHELNHAGPFVVKSQDSAHPFYAAQYMTGADHIGSNAGEGDPEWVNIVPVQQYLDKYVFFTDPTYSETSLVVVRTRSQLTGEFEDVTLDCRGVLQGWQPVGEHEYVRIDLVTGDFFDIAGCSNGRHEISSTAPFGVTVWGWGSSAATFFTEYVSYAYPAGAGVQPINEVVVEVPK